MFSPQLSTTVFSPLGVSFTAPPLNFHQSHCSFTAPTTYCTHPVFITIYPSFSPNLPRSFTHHQPTLFTTITTTMSIPNTPHLPASIDSDTTPADTIPHPPTATSSGPIALHFLSPPSETEHSTVEAINKYLQVFCPANGYMLRVCNNPAETSLVLQYECCRAGKPPKPVKQATIQSECEFTLTASFDSNTSTWRLVPGNLGHTHSFEHFLPAPPIAEFPTRLEMDEHVQRHAPLYGYTIRVGRSWNTIERCTYACSCAGKAPPDPKRKVVLCECLFKMTTSFNSETRTWQLVYDHLGHTHPPDYTVKQKQKRNNPRVAQLNESAPTTDVCTSPYIHPFLSHRCSFQAS